MPIFGLSGPHADFMGFGGNAEAMAGLGYLRSYLDSDPSTRGSSNHMDATSGPGVAYAALVALYERERTGRGQFIEFCQIEHLIQHLGGPLMDGAMNGRAQRALGNRDPVRAPQGIYRCRGEGRIAVSVGTDEEWAGLCQAMGRPGLAQATEYAGNLARQTRHDELDGLLSGWTSTQESRELMGLLQRHGVPRRHRRQR